MPGADWAEVRDDIGILLPKKVLLGLLDQQQKVMSVQCDRHFDRVVHIQIKFDQCAFKVVGLIMAVADPAVFQGKKLGPVFVDFLYSVTDLVHGILEEIKS